MAIELLAKPEAFAQAVASGKTQSEAYRLAGYSCSRLDADALAVKASDLAKKGKVKGRIAELRAPAVAKVGLTLESHLQELEALREAAKDAGQFAAAVTAETNRGKAGGLYTEKHELTGKDGQPIKTESVVTLYLPDNGRAKK